jgi:hypothetical protein
MTKLLLLIMLSSFYSARLIDKNAAGKTKAGFVMIPEGAYMYDTTNALSKKTTFIPYNDRIEILKETSDTYKAGILSSHWIKVNYRGYAGFIPQMNVFKHQLIDTSSIKRGAISGFLEQTLGKADFFYQEKKNAVEYSSGDSVFIKNMTVSNCYLYIKLVLNGGDLPFPDELSSDHFSYAQCVLDIAHTISKDGNLASLAFNWQFDGGNTTLEFTQLKRGVGVSVSYYAD